MKEFVLKGRLTLERVTFYVSSSPGCLHIFLP